MPSYDLGLTTVHEELDVPDLPVRGELPPWLAGTLVRNGPARFEVERQPCRHWFDGFSMLRSFSFQDGTVSYANRYLRSGDYCESTRRGKISRRNFATDPCRSIFQRVLSIFSRHSGSGSDNANVNIARIADRYIAMTETPMPVEFDPRTLKTLGAFDYGGDRLGGTVTTAHPHFDFERRQVFNYTTKFSRDSKYVFYRISSQNVRRETFAEISARKPAYVHSFGMTEQNLVFVEFPLLVDPLNLLLSGKSFIENFRWEPERGARFYLINKDDGSVRSFTSEAFFAFHHINAFEQHGDVFVDVAAYPDKSIIDALYLDRLRAGEPIPQSELRRYRLCAGRCEASYERLIPEPIELPRINYEDKGGRDYRYAYGISNRRDRPAEFPNQLIKADVKERGVKTWTEEGCYVGEPVFVRAPEASAEDEGVVVSVVLDSRKGNSFLLVLDAASFSELARAEAPHHIPFELHGQFFAD